jgi:hypothetical protein
MAEITGKIAIEELIKDYPETIKVLMNYGVRALVCGESSWGTLEEVAAKSGVKDIDGLIKDLNSIVDKD